MSARKPAASKGALTTVINVIPIREKVSTAAEIEAEVMGRHHRVEEEIRADLIKLAVLMRDNHEYRARDALPIAREMTRATLDSWLEIGRRLLAQGGGLPTRSPLR